MEEHSSVRSLARRTNSQSEEVRRTRRLETQASRRNMGREDFSLSCRTLLQLCKAGKLSVAQFRELSQALSSRPEFSLELLTTDGCLHSLVGYLSGSEPAKQVLAVQCLVNLAGHGQKCPLIAKSAGAYLITLISGTNKVLAENSCLVISNLCLSDRLTVPILLNLEAQQSLLSLAQNSVDSLQEAALQALYNLLRTEAVWLEQPGQLAAACLEMFSSTNSPDLKPPIHLLWLLYLMSSQSSLHNYLANTGFLHHCLDVATYEIFQKCDSRPLVKLLTPVVRILANLAAGPDSVSVCLSLVRHQDFPTILTALLSTNYTHLCRESLWLFANIVNNENVTVQEEFVNLDLMDKLETHAVHAVGRLDPYALG